MNRGGPDIDLRAGADVPLDQLRLHCGPLIDSLVNSGQAIAISDCRLPDHPIVFVNAAFETLTGYRREEVIGRNCRILQSEETDSGTRERIRAAMVAGEPVTVDLRNVRRDGTGFWNRLHLAPVLDGTGAAVLYLGTLADVTALLAREELEAQVEAGRRQLLEARERIRLMQTVAGAAGAWEWDVPGNRLYADARFATLYGIDPLVAAHGVPTERFFAAVHPDDRMRLRIAVAGVMHGADVFFREYRIVGSDGSVRWVSARGGADRDEAEAPVRFHGVLSDITEQKRVEEQLHVAQTAGGIGTFEYVTGFGTVSVSEQFCRLLGLLPADNLPVGTINSLVHPGDPPLIGGADERRAGKLSSLESRIARADTGETRWLARRGQYRRDGRMLGERFIGVIYDVTASKASQEELRKLTETLEQRVEERTRERDRVWNNSRELLVVIGADAVVQAASPSWTARLGHPVEEVVGRAFQHFVHSEDVERTTQGLELARANADLTDFENRCLHRDGSFRWISWNTSAEGDLIYGYGRDFTEARERAEALREAEEQLRQAQKMEAVGQLTGGLAHDFNNMLMGITGSLELIRRRIAAGRIAEIEPFMDAALASAKRAAALTHRLLAFSRRQTLDPSKTDVNALVGSIEDLLRRTLGEQIVLQVVLDPTLAPAFSDANQLESAILNLAINARDAMPYGGRLTIASANVTLDSRYSGAHEGVGAGDYVMITVTDTGVGMPRDVLTKVFEPFYTTKPIGQGTGLGLSMIYGFMKQIGGHVRIESEPGHGTAVHLYLPKFKGGGADAGTDGDGRGAVPLGSGESVLVVEDDESVRLLIMEVLNELGYRAFEVSDSRAALDFIEASRPLDLMITDVGLPGLNGRQLAEIARSRRPDLPVLFVTAYAANAAVRSDFLAPGMEMIAKPFAMDELASRIRAMLEKA